MSGGVTRRPLIGLVIPAAIAVLFIAVPLIGLLAHVDWSTLPAQLVSTDVLTALRLSLECSIIAVAISLVVGVPLAYLLARSSLPGRRVIRGLVTLPLVLPPVVGGSRCRRRWERRRPDRHRAAALRDRVAVQHRRRRDRRSVRRLSLPGDHRSRPACGSATSISRRWRRPSARDHGGASGA